MCGIAGIYAPGRGLASEELLLSMAGELIHRGPDGVGLFLHERFGMVNTRLAIIDIDGGDQPIGNETGRYWVMQNGEIYNYRELRVELELLGHRFVTSCDTEVIVHAFEAWGADFLVRLNGDFAIALWDTRERQLFLARDRFGVRPLFLAERAGALSFASEAKALLRDPRLPREFDPACLTDTFTFWSVLPDRSAFKGVRELPAGHYLRYGPEGLIEERRWWDLPFDAERPESEDVDELAEALRLLLEDATRIRLRADVPVGAYLSGGLDSSAIAALVGAVKGGELRAFSIGFRDDRYDESGHQDRMAEHLGVRLSRVTVSDRDIARALPEVVELAEKPLLRTASAPLLLLSALVRSEGFKVVLTGEGADELFAGYEIFKEMQLRRFWLRQPQSRLRPLLIDRLYPYLGTELSRGGGFTRGFFLRAADDPHDPLFSHRIRASNTARCRSLLRPEVVSAAISEGTPEDRLLSRLPVYFDALSPLSKAQYIECNTFLTGFLLHAQGDRMMMGNSVEGRFPFLDHRLAEFAGTLPAHLRLRGLKEKYLLRRALSTALPPEVVRRRKRPYRAPILRSLLGPDAPDFVEALLSPENLERSGIFDVPRVGRLLRRCRGRLETGAGEIEEMALVAVLSTELLHDSLISRPSLATPVAPSRVVRIEPALLGEVGNG